MNKLTLIKRCIEKDRKAWGVFIKKYSRLIYWAIRKQLTASNTAHNEADIKDIFQEVFLVIHNGNKLLQLKNPNFLPGWLAMTASCKTIDFMRKKERAEKNLVVNMPILKDYSMEQKIYDTDMLSAVKEAISVLSDKERIVISLNILEERTHKEIADIVSVSANTVSTIIARTKKKLQKELQKKGIPDKL